MRVGRRAVFILLAAALLLLPSARLTAAASYDVTPLTGPGGTFQPRQINDHREVVGGLGSRPVLWLPQAKYGLPAGANDLSTQSGYADDFAFGINNHGQIAGTGHSPPFTASGQPVVWLPSPAYGRPAGWSVVEPVSGDVSRINDAGEMAGHHHSVEQAMVWLPAAAHGLPAGMTDIATTGWGFATDINGLGQVAGRDFDLVTTTDRGFIFLPEPAHGRAAGVHFIPATGTSPTAINNRGSIVGSYATQTINGVDTNRAFVWRPSTTLDGPAGFFDLGGVPGDATHWRLSPNDINDFGQVVGTRTITTPADPVSVSNAFLWTRTGGMVDLNSLIDPNSGWILRSATSINAGGDVVGTGTFNGVPSAYMLTVPEPSAAALLAPLAVACLRRRRTTRTCC